MAAIAEKTFHPTVHVKRSLSQVDSDLYNLQVGTTSEIREFVKDMRDRLDHASATWAESEREVKASVDDTNARVIAVESQVRSPFRTPVC